MNLYSLIIIPLLLAAPLASEVSEIAPGGLKVESILVYDTNQQSTEELSLNLGLGTAIERLLSTANYWYPIDTSNPRANPSPEQSVAPTTMADFLTATRECYLHIRWSSPLLVTGSKKGTGIELREAVLSMAKDANGRRIPNRIFGVSTEGQLVVLDKYSGSILITEVLPLIN